MKLDRLHRRLAVAMALASLVAFAGGAGFEPVASILAGAVLLAVLVRPPGDELARRLERWLGPLVVVLVIRVLAHVFLVGGDVVVPVVDLLLLLLSGEALRPLDSSNDVRIYALSFALLLASTAYRPGILFALAFVAFVLLASVTVPIGHLRRQAQRFGTKDMSVDRRLVLTSLALSSVTLVSSALVFLVFPRVSRAGPGFDEVLARSVAGFADRISIGEHGSTIRANPEVVLRVEFPSGLPPNPAGLHWRGRSYDRFDGIQWSRTTGIRPSATPGRWYEERWTGPRIAQDIYAAPLDVRVLFALHPVVDIDAHGGIRPMFDNVGDFSYWGSGSPAYRAVSVYGRPSPDSLRAAEGAFMPDRARYLQLPRLPDRIHALADSLTRDQETLYDRVSALERWLQNEFDYTRDLPATAAQATLDHFLFERRAGHCEYFSTAMVVLLRAAGIHSRNVNGFLGGQWNGMGSYLAVTQNEAHSWAEVWFPGYGWITFDPTPAGVAGGSAQTPWFWPGRLFFDGLQHRWSKWVLDYSLTEQSGALRRLTRLFDLDRSPEQGSRGEEPASGLLVWALLAMVVLFGLDRAIRRRGGSHHPDSVPYLRLLRAARRRGIVGSGAITPFELVRRIGRHAPAAEGPTERLVRLYVKGRFSGRPPSPDERSAMRRALRAARAALGTSRRPGRRPGLRPDRPVASGTAPPTS